MHFKQPVKHTPHHIPLLPQPTGNNRWDFSTFFRLMTSPCCAPWGGGGALVVAGMAKGCHCHSHSHLAESLIRQLSCQREACAPAEAAADTRRHHPEKVAGFPHKLLSIKGRDPRRHYGYQVPHFNMFRHASELFQCSHFDLRVRLFLVPAT